MMKTPLLAVLALTTTAGGVAPAQGISAQRTPWLHVRVEEPAKRTRVHVNLPMPVVEAALKAAPDTIASHGRIHLGPAGRHLGISDLREAWKELRAAGDMDIVTVEDKDERVNVSRRGDHVRIRVEATGKREQVHVDVPVALVDALLSGSGDDLDVKAGLAELRKLRGDIVRVSERDTTVRVWIDEESSPPQGGK